MPSLQALIDILWLQLIKRKKYNLQICLFIAADHLHILICITINILEVKIYNPQKVFIVCKEGTLHTCYFIHLTVS